jgi:hypothetical protein
MRVSTRRGKEGEGDLMFAEEELAHVHGNGAAAERCKALRERLCVRTRQDGDWCNTG